MRKIVSGYRIFKCDNCLLEVKWPTRDCHSPSGEHCPECLNFIHPSGHEEHSEWPKDASGNLLHDKM